MEQQTFKAYIIKIQLKNSIRYWNQILLVRSFAKDYFITLKYLEFHNQIDIDVYIYTEYGRKTISE